MSSSENGANLMTIRGCARRGRILTVPVAEVRQRNAVMKTPRRTTTTYVYPIAPDRDARRINSTYAATSSESGDSGLNTPRR
jgi:hypothetical protein